MSRTHHSSSAYRLSCDCLVEYTSVHQTGTVPKAAVLCPNHRESAYIMERYPPDTCAVTARASTGHGGVIKARCTEKPGHAGNHFDTIIALGFVTPGKLKSGREGNT